MWIDGKSGLLNIEMLRSNNTMERIIFDEFFFSPGYWYHILISHERNLLQKSLCTLFVNGVKVQSQKLSYLDSRPGPVKGFVGSFSSAGKPLSTTFTGSDSIPDEPYPRLRWRLASCWLATGFADPQLAQSLHFYDTSEFCPRTRAGTTAAEYNRLALRSFAGLSMLRSSLTPQLATSKPETVLDPDVIHDEANPQDSMQRPSPRPPEEPPLGLLPRSGFFFFFNAAIRSLGKPQGNIQLLNQRTPMNGIMRPAMPAPLPSKDIPEGDESPELATTEAPPALGNDDSLAEADDSSVQWDEGDGFLHSLVIVFPPEKAESTTPVPSRATAPPKVTPKPPVANRRHLNLPVAVLSLPCRLFHPRLPTTLFREIYAIERCLLLLEDKTNAFVEPSTPEANFQQSMLALLAGIVLNNPTNLQYLSELGAYQYLFQVLPVPQRILAMGFIGLANEVTYYVKGENTFFFRD